MRLALLAIALSLASLASGQDGDLAAPVWVAQKAMTTAFRFSVLTTAIDDSLAPVGLRMYDRRTGRLVQEVLGIDGLDVRRRADGLVRLVDANFDGHPDIELAIDRGGVGPNNTSHFYLYSPATQRFEIKAMLSALTQVRINRDRTISAFARGGCCNPVADLLRPAVRTLAAAVQMAA